MLWAMSITCSSQQLRTWFQQLVEPWETLRDTILFFQRSERSWLWLLLQF